MTRHATSEVMHRWGSELGFTLAEVMIALAISTILAVAGYSILISSDKSTRANEQIVGTQHNVRMAMELISRDIKLAGFRMPQAPNAPVGGTAGNCSASGTPTAIRPVDKVSTTSVAPNDDGADTLSLVVPKTMPGWTLSAVVPSGTSSFNALTLSTTAVADMKTDGMADGSGAYISIGGVVAGQVTTSSGSTINLANTYNLPMTFAAGTQVYLLQCVTYSVGTTTAACGTDGPCLLRTVDTGTAPATTTNIVDGIEDIQFALACDGCNNTVKSGVPDGVVDDWNGNNQFDTGDWQTNRVWAPLTFNPATIRLVEVNIVSRQTSADLGTGEGQKAGIQTAAPLTVSDHLHSNDPGYSLATYQQFRRRLLTRAVAARNIEQ
ncbi:MAG TPA: PilW family protein [Nitrospira sp.]|nr:PilW family protein [Nitrospira sp.]